MKSSDSICSKTVYKRPESDQHRSNTLYKSGRLASCKMLPSSECFLFGLKYVLNAGKSTNSTINCHDCLPSAVESFCHTQQNQYITHIMLSHHCTTVHSLQDVVYQKHLWIYLQVCRHIFFEFIQVAGFMSETFKTLLLHVPFNLATPDIDLNK